MRASQYFITTTREAPADAELISHRLMLQAGMIRKVGAGIYNWLPLGLRVLKKVENIIRTVMESLPAVEVLMPVLQPADFWEQSGRWEAYGAELLRVKDRHQRDFCFGPTHEEIITALMQTELKSYKQLPKVFFQIQTKFRDEIRPRFGVMRAREFVMKDAYSFHDSSTSLEETYEKMHQAYCTIFETLGLRYRAVLADTGSIGGNYSHEFHVLADAGEDLIAYCPESDYAANREMATTGPDVASESVSIPFAEKIVIDTPDLTTIKAVADFTKTDEKQYIKAIVLKGKDSPVVLLLLRGDDTLNEIKAAKLPEVFQPLTFSSAEEIKENFDAPPGFIGPCGLKDIPIIIDTHIQNLINFTCGANQKDKHFCNVNWERDATYDRIADLRNVKAGDRSPDGAGFLALQRGIEIGHIFQLGQKYSAALGLNILNQNGKAIAPWMGCYGIGVSRIVAAAIEQSHDEKGIIWPKNMAPFFVIIIPVAYYQSNTVREATESLYQKLSETYEVLLDDRKERPGVLFADADLIGIPHRVVLSEKTLSQGFVEYKSRNTQESILLSTETLLEKLAGE